MASYAKVGQDKPSDLQEVVPAEAKEWLRAIYQLGEFNAKSFRGDWLRDGSGYTVLEPVAGMNERELVSYDVTSGKRTVLASLSQLVPPGATDPLAIGSYTFSPDCSWLLIQASMSGAEGRVSGTWILELNSGKLRKAGAGRFISISPDGRHILYSEQGNLFAYDIHNGETIALTKNAVVGSVSNSRAVWSPDGKHIAFVESDASDVRFRQMLVPGDPSYPEVREVRFARVGGTISSLRVGVVDARGSETRWLSIPEPAEGLYFGEVSWAGNSHEILVEKLSRFRDEREFLIADIRSGGSNTLNAMFRKPDVYHVGIAVAPKPQPHLYNAWFQEIYMRTREVNPEGYLQSAPINFAEGLKGDLLIIHGTGETNTHLEITEGLVDRLIELGKSFDYMTYPNRNHGIRAGKGTSLHLHMLMTRYLLTHLPPGPR
jgi:dipeptidyl aminopeptidase/acylaminoacyl peptidase